MVTDATGEEALEVHTEDGSLPARRLTVDPLVLGSPAELVPSPEGPLVAVVNTRGELLLVDTATSAVRVVDFSDQEDGVADVAWSPCGCWVAYQVRVCVRESMPHERAFRIAARRGSHREVAPASTPQQFDWRML